MYMTCTTNKKDHWYCENPNLPKNSLAPGSPAAVRGVQIVLVLDFVIYTKLHVCYKT